MELSNQKQGEYIRSEARAENKALSIALFSEPDRTGRSDRENREPG